VIPARRLASRIARRAVVYLVSDTARFFLLSLSAACAAASLAIGTRYGEQLT
jgi:hypothetical protein